MPRLLHRSTLSCDDILLVPQYNTVRSRLDTNVSTKLSRNIEISHPFVSTNMAAVTDINMIKAMWATGSTGILHRFLKPSEIVSKVKSLNIYKEGNFNRKIVISIGVKEEDDKTIRLIYDKFDTYKIDAVMIDIAHADSIYVYEMITKVRSLFGNGIDIIVGNIATREAAKRMCDTNIDGVRIGVGGGGCCSTRTITGFGISTLQSVMDCADVCQKYNIPIIADGGIKSSGDAAKLLAFGADSCTMGTILAGTSESPSDVIKMDGLEYKKVYGMACYSNDTEILTIDGWKYFNNLSKDDKIATLNISNNYLEYQNPSNIYSYNYNGDMINVHSKFVNLCVTPNHRMYVAKRARVSDGYKRKFKFVLAKDVLNSDFIYKKTCLWHGEDVEYFTIPNTDINIPMEEWMYFFGFWLAEGCTYRPSNPSKNGNSERYIRMCISNTDFKKLTIYNNILLKNNIKSKIYKKKNCYEIYSSNIQLNTYLEQFGKSYNKFIPKEFKILSPKYLQKLIDGFMDGDGSISRHCLYTTSKKLMEDFTEIALKCSIPPQASINQRAGTSSGKFNHNYDLYSVHLPKTVSETFVKSQNNNSIIKYNDNVWCVEVPNGVVYVKRNNRMCWCGNSKEAQELLRDGLKEGTAPEGVSRYVPYLGDTEKFVKELTGGIRSAFTYAGAYDIHEFRQNVEYTILSSGGMLESKHFSKQ